MMKLFSRRDKEMPDPPRPERPLWVVGDVHGCADRLRDILEKVPDADDLAFVGDYVDRGPDSRKVTELLMALPERRSGKTICLMGNHERMMLDFLDDPVFDGPLWLSNGGVQTLVSFGHHDVSELSDAQSRNSARDRFRAAFSHVEDWLRDRPLMWRSGSVAVVHAATEAKLPLEAQREQVMLWGRQQYTSSARPDGVWVVHGHTPVDRAYAEHGHINVDTGAVFGGPLTAVHIGPDGGYDFFRA
ncbi:MAG: serine/threonine protein phosphatase [Rhodobacteraceae bacterium]|nr:serine/threonine protein phosphatase [Paracoccaceae bacterium]